MINVNKYSHEIAWLILILLGMALAYMIFKSLTSKKVLLGEKEADEVKAKE